MADKAESGWGPFTMTMKMLALALIPLLAVLWKFLYPLIPDSLSDLRYIYFIPPTSIVLSAFALWFKFKVAGWIFWWSLKRYCNRSPPEIALHHFIRDSGLFHHLMSVMSFNNAKFILSHRPFNVIYQGLRLTWNRKVFAYGYQSTSQFVELHLPPTQQLQHSPQPQREVKGLAIFFHGGAWGSGDPYMYRLVALPFEKMNWATAIVGHRTYPEGDASSQVHDLEMAMKEIQKRYPDICSRKLCLMGHSSGAHISMLTIVERVRRKLELEHAGDALVLQQWEESLVKIDSFIGISGPYNICNHFEFEAGRGVEQLSPMKPACGNSQEMFLRYSPAVQASRMYAKCSSTKQRRAFTESFPPMHLVHGMEDETVPYGSSKEAARVLRSCGISQCRDIYEKDTGHEQSIMQIMVGGPVQDIVQDIVTDLTREQ